MSRGYKIFMSIEFAFVASLVASFGALGIVGLLVGFETEWRQVITSMVVTLASVLGAAFGLYLALDRINRA